MSDISQLWSEPWHALLHRLAAGAAAEGKPENPRAPSLNASAFEERTWLVRARKLEATKPRVHF
jgi:hypothetical protein